MNIRDEIAEKIKIFDTVSIYWETEINQIQEQSMPGTPDKVNNR